MVLGTSHAQVFDRLYEDSPQIKLTQPLSWAVTVKDSVASPEAFNAAEDWNFQPYTASTALPTSDRLDVWARFSLPATAIPQSWFIRIPRQTIQRVTLFSRGPDGNWLSQSAGEAIAPAEWSLRTRVPSFELQTHRDSDTTYFLRFEHRNPITERPMMLSAMEYVDGASRIGLVIGLMWGMVGLLSVLCVAVFSITQNKVFLWFGAFVITLMFTQLVLIGYAGWRMWPQSAHLNQVMGWISALLAVSSGAWFSAQASYSRESHPHLYRLLAVIASGSLLMACLLAVNQELIPRVLRNLWMAVAILSIIGSMVWMSFRGQVWNLMLLASAAPIGLAALARLSYNVGWIMHVEIAQTAGIFSALIGLISTFLVLTWRSREALLAGERTTAFATYDAASGLMLPHVVEIRLPQMLVRASRRKPGCGVLMMRWVDVMPAARNETGEDQRNTALARIGAILRGVSRDVDTVVRHGDDEFMMLVEGPVSRKALSEVSTQVLAACIRSSRQSGNDYALNLHIAIWHGGEGVHTTEAVIELLKTRLHQMSAGTKRPVQFVDGSDPASQPEENPERRREDLLAKINALEISHPALSEEKMLAGSTDASQ